MFKIMQLYIVFKKLIITEICNEICQKQCVLYNNFVANF